MSNVEILSAVHGIAPRSDALLKLGGDVERGRASREAYDELIYQETNGWLSLQEQAGIDILEDGKLWWQDHLRVIVKSAHGFASNIDDAPVTRWFETNRFYRKPTIKDELRFDADKFETTAPEIRSLGPNISLLSPDSFAALCNNEYKELSAEENVLQLYGELLFYFKECGVKRVLLEDYSPESTILGNELTLQYAQALADLSKELQLGLIAPGRSKIAIPYSPNPTNLELNVENSTLEHLLKHMPPYQRPPIAGRTLWQQIIDAATTSTEVLDVKAWSVDSLRALDPSRLILTHTVDLECLPLPYAREKVKRLGEFTTRVRDYLEAY